MKKHIRAFVSLLCAAVLALGCASCGGAAQSTGKSGGTAGVTHITVWTYYNGDQLESFNKLVDQFNETTGREKGIRVKSASQGSVSDLETNVMDAAQGKAPAAEPAASVPAASEPETPQENSLLPADEPQKDAAPAAESTAPAADTGKGELHETV